MTRSASIRWTMLSLMLGLTGLVAGCAPAKNLLHRAHTACRNAELRSLCTPLPSPCYCGVTEMYGYYGTCWRPWPGEWVPCREPCFTCGPPPTDQAMPLEVVPAEAAPAEALPPPAERAHEAPPPSAPPIGPAAGIPVPIWGFR